MKFFVKTSAVLLASMMMFAGNAFAEAPTCGEAPDDSWMPPEALLELAQGMGYTIESIEVSEGNCYQMAGTNAEGKAITAYLDPRTGDVVQEDAAE